MAVSKTYDSRLIEDKWYQAWLDNKVFKSSPNPDKEPFTIVIPPPNVTGVLHMGHMMNNTIQDILVRRARMQGKEACWVPGTDHASIATETKVVNLLAEQGISKDDLTRDEFLKHAWEWKEKYGGIILKQLQRLGASCDWDRTAFTMDPSLSEAVTDVFVKLHEKGWMYRGVRMVNWDPKGQTALSDEEVNYKEVQSKLYYFNYQLVDSDETVTIATTRPETILGDTAICINPNDPRYSHLKGKKAIVPMVNREIPIIEDEYVDIEFGTGCLKVTPAHDLNDYELGLKHNLEVIDIFNDNGTLNDAAGFFVGEDRFVVRKKMVKALKESGHFLKDEDITNNVGYSERTDVVIEPKLSAQWFCKMEEMAKPALDNVMNDNIKIHPPKFKNMYRSWMENVRDWCVSRQLWWGHRIPAYYLPSGECVVARSAEEALEKAKEIDNSVTLSDLNQDEDVLDTWFSSWLWPMSVFDGIRNPDNEEFKYYYPTNDLVTGFDIIFFWVARMVMGGYEFADQLPFKNVYITGMVRDEKRRKMSKQLGNSPDALALMDKYSADGVRVGMLFAAPAGNDLLFDEKLCEQGRGFTIKIWNAYRFIESLEVDEKLPPKNEQAIKWFENRFNQVVDEVEDDFSKYRISDALMATYKLTKDEFCSWYLEMVKPDFEQPIDRHSYDATLRLFEKVLTIVHPFMPFVTEELWAAMQERSEGSFLTTSAWPESKTVDIQVINDVAIVKEVVTAIRNLRTLKGIAKKDPLELIVITKNEQLYIDYKSLIQKLAGISDITFTSEKVEGAASIVVQADEFFIPIGELVDEEAEREEMLKELKYMKGFLISVDKKLQNERFVSGAPAQVVANEKKKRDDAEAKIKALEASLGVNA